jgi:pSer/pThr/pTyr-binding forkhead associated (FHA) protein
MALTIALRAARAREAGDAFGADGEPPQELSITLDSPRVVIGRGEGCEVRLPDPSVSHRHASIRQRGGEHILMDEKSTNGTFIGRVMLPPQSPRVVRSGELVRVGRVWLEIRIEPKLVTGSGAAAAKELALELVARGLASQGEDPHPRIHVIEGPDRGKELRLTEAGRRYILGRGKEADLVLDDADASRRHADVARKGDHLVVHDLGSKGGTALEGAPLGQADAAWKPGQVLAFGANRFVFDFPAAEALAELERSPDEVIPPGESFDPVEPSQPEASPELTPSPDSTAAPISRPRSDTPAPSRADSGGWSLTDGAVVLLALGILVLSIAGLWLLLSSK